ncbi:sensor histidine kinase [Haloarchaeobius sp. DFWS5]|uniref:sensor histidine kinase n=1 Tax=Haloarchaeobius sp. DFWS5 TaxID=3446114 RepID=UPI003EBC9E10
MQSEQNREFNRRLQREKQLNSILNRILRHNLRNKITIIDGYLTHAVAPQLADEESGTTDEIRTAVEELKTISEKAAHLNRQLDREPVLRTVSALNEAVSETAERTAMRFPSAHISTTLADESEQNVVLPSAFEWLLEELLENAVEHNDSGVARASVAVTTTNDGVQLVVTDDGPGLPAIERELALQELEDPLTHSEGIGLWAVRILIDQAGGSVQFTEAETGGVEIVLTVDYPSHSDAMGRDFASV